MYSDLKINNEHLMLVSLLNRKYTYAANKCCSKTTKCVLKIPCHPLLCSSFKIIEKTKYP